MKKCFINGGFRSSFSKSQCKQFVDAKLAWYIFLILGTSHCMSQHDHSKETLLDDFVKRLYMCVSKFVLLSKVTAKNGREAIVNGAKIQVTLVNFRTRSVSGTFSQWSPITKNMEISALRFFLICHVIVEHKIIPLQ